MYLRSSTVQHLSVLSFNRTQTLLDNRHKTAKLTPYLDIQTELICVTKDVKGKGVNC